MRICIVTPSEEFVASAGVRIRYDRLAVAARELGHEIALQPIADFQSRGDFQHDVYIFAKTYTPIACLLARRMRQSGRRVGLDIFDDYFTQTADTRLLRYRLWFNDMAEIADFFLCSTERLAAAITALIGNKPLAVIADPSEVIDQQFLDHVVERKARQIAAGEPVRITWFGIGDNPYFPVGVRDLAAFGGALEAFSRDRRCELRILTNMRALSPSGLAMLRRLPLPYSIEEWTPQRERDDLLKSHVCFLPVNGQPFSRVKSLNRAITALTAGCQVLSAGFPLYDGIGPFVYRSAERLWAGLLDGSALLRAATVGEFAALMTARANPFRGATAMAALIEAIAEPAEIRESGLGPEAWMNAQWPPIARFPADTGVLHGSLPDGKLHKLVQRFNGFAVKGPTCREDWNCHMRLDAGDGGRLQVFVAAAMMEHLDPEFLAACVPHGKIKDLEFTEVRLQPPDLAARALGWSLADGHGAPKLYALAPRLAVDAMAICRTLFPRIHFINNDKLAAVAPGATP